MITVKLKVYDNKFDEFLETIQSLNNDVIEKIDYKLPKPKRPKAIKKTKPKPKPKQPKPKLPKVIYKPYTFDNLTPFKDLTIKDNCIFYEDKELKTIQLIGKYKPLTSMIERKGLSITKSLKDNPLSEIIESMENIKDNKHRLSRDKFKPKSEIVMFSDLTIMIITQHTPLLFDYAIEYKKAKSAYCLITIIGLEHLKNENTVNTVLSFIRRKAFKLYKVEPF